MKTPREPALSDLPSTIPIFPLTGALLLPRGRMPLNIFEPRYLAMIDHALASTDRLVGMIQPREPDSEGMTRDGVAPPPTALYPTGCAGRVVNFTETRDRRYIITLRGACRFNLVEELDAPKGYRRARVDFAAWQGDLVRDEAAENAIDRARLLKSLRGYFSTQKLQVDWEAVSETPNYRLVTMLAMPVRAPSAIPEADSIYEVFDEVPPRPPAIAAMESTVRISCRCSTSPSAPSKSASAARPVTVPRVSKKSLSSSEKTARPAATAPMAPNAPNRSTWNNGEGLTKPMTDSGTLGMFKPHPVGFSSPGAAGSVLAPPMPKVVSSTTAKSGRAHV